jgi:adenosylmethionine-8-amino-7-oxononanoate aminotransferase
MTSSGRLVVHRRWGKVFPVIDHAEGVYLYDTTGKRYIDAAGGSSVVINLGHGNKEVVDALAQQALRVAFSPAHVFANAPAEELGEMVAALAPGTMKDACRVWFTCTGTDAVDDAVPRMGFVAVPPATNERCPKPATLSAAEVACVGTT